MSILKLIGLRIKEEVSLWYLKKKNLKKIMMKLSLINKITEYQIEQFSIELLEKQGYQYIYCPDIALDSEGKV